MNRKLKIDLHTHCGEALDNQAPGTRVVAEIIQAVKQRGLDGIAITEHKTFRYGSAVKTVVEAHFPDAGIIIIPGREIEFGYGFHVVELQLPNNGVFKFLAHPKKVLENLDGICGIEIENGMNGVNAAVALEMANKHNLVLLKNSDAHRLEDIGTFYNEIEIDDATGKWFVKDSRGNLAEMKHGAFDA